MLTYRQPLVDSEGDVLFWCEFCGAPIAGDDLFEQGLRLPDPDETADEYREAELIDSMRHLACAQTSLRPTLT